MPTQSSKVLIAQRARPVWPLLLRVSIEPEDQIVLLSWRIPVEVPLHAAEQGAKVLDRRRKDDACVAAAGGLPRLIERHVVHHVVRQDGAPLRCRVTELVLV